MDGIYYRGIIITKIPQRSAEASNHDENIHSQKNKDRLRETAVTREIIHQSGMKHILYKCSMTMSTQCHIESSVNPMIIQLFMACKGKADAHLSLSAEIR